MAFRTINTGQTDVRNATLYRPDTSVLDAHRPFQLATKRRSNNDDINLQKVCAPYLFFPCPW